jgi:RNA polymerase sigma factor (sigma-70 family)
MSKILVVDNDPAIVGGLVSLLTSENIEAVGAEDSETAERLVRAGFFAVVLADLRLRSENDGMELIDAVARISPRSRLAAMTGFLTPEIEAELERRGATLVLQKPFDIENAVAALREMALTIAPHQAASDDDIESLYAQSLPLLRSIALRRYGLDHDAADDLVQEAWCLFLERRAAISSPRAWLAGTITNLCRQQIRKLCRARTFASEIAVEAFEEPTETVLAVQQALATLDPRSRKLCELIALERRPYADVSTAMKLPIGSVGPMYLRAKTRMARALAC